MADVSPCSMRMALEMKQLGRKDDGEAFQDDDLKWFRAAPVSAFPEDGGACVMIHGRQIAVFNFARRGQWYACQNLCPHKREMVLSRGMLGSARGEPKIACPFHKATFSLESGACLNSDLDAIDTYAVRVVGDEVYVGLAAADLNGLPSDGGASGARP